MIAICANPTWYYRLNSLVSKAVSEHGTVALINALAEVRKRETVSSSVLGSYSMRATMTKTLLQRSPQWSPQNRPTVVRAKPANGKRPGTQLFYPATSCAGKSIFVRQLRGPHLST